MPRERAVCVVLPGDVDDATAPSGGNAYDRRLCQGLAADGWSVREVALAGGWPRPAAAASAALACELDEVPEGTVVLIDGLVACGVPDVLVPRANRLRLVVLVHLPLADETGLASEVATELDGKERDTLRAARAVVATSSSAARRLIRRHELDPRQVHVVEPGTDPAPLAPGTDGARRLLCVASVTPRKGHDLLIEALAVAADLPWHCECVGPLGQDPGYLDGLRRRVERHDLGDRVRFSGPLTRELLAGRYAAADLVVLPSRAETYGMVVTEALARGIPVLATALQGVLDALGRDPAGHVPGIVVPPDSGQLATGLRRWFTEPELRRGLRVSARARRGMLPGWAGTTRRMAGVLEPLR